MARNPARQLNSKSIRDAIFSYIVPSVEKKFCIVSGKCTWRVTGNEELAEAWKLISQKRHQCDAALSKLTNVGFYFSAIASCEPKAKSGKKKASEEDEEEAVVQPSQNQSGHSCIDIAVEKRRLPAISYWIAFESTNGSQVSVVPLRKAWFECDVEVDVKVLKGKQLQNIAKTLCTVCKDHSSTYMAKIAQLSYEYVEREVLLEIEDQLFESEERDYFVLQFYLAKQVYWQDLREGVAALQRAGLQLQLNNTPGNEELVKGISMAPEITANPITQLINDVERVMRKNKYGLCKGEVLKLAPGSRYTFQPKTTVDEFIGTLEGHPKLRAALVQHAERIKEKLKKPDTQVIQQLEIDHDLIEVSDGWCLSLSQRQFVHAPIQAADEGKISPRAFVQYDHQKRPEPKFFKEILENSLTDDKIRAFCSDYLGLLRFQQKKHKEKVRHFEKLRDMTNRFFFWSYSK